MGVNDEAKKIQAEIRAKLEEKRQMLARTVKVDGDGKVTLSLTADDWQLYLEMEGRDTVARNLNAMIADEINTGFVGAELMRRCHAVLVLHSSYGAADSEGSGVLCDVLIHVKGDHEYDRFARHHSDYIAGWRQIGTVEAEHELLWIGDPEEGPVTPPPPRKFRQPTVRYKQYSNPRGIAVTVPRPRAGGFSVEGLFPSHLNGRMTAIRVLLP